MPKVQKPQLGQAATVQPQTGLSQLYYGDNLDIMQKMPIESVDLIYLDPPFNSKQSYNLLYRTLTGRPVPEQTDAFCDTWEMDAEKEALADAMPHVLAENGIESYYVDFWRLWIRALRNTQPHLLAYLIYMVLRLIHMKKLMRPTASIYLHCDSTASHYIKVMMDGIFGHQNFRNEIIWQRTGAHSDANRWGRVSDTILFYTKTDNWTWHTQYIPYTEEYIAERYKYVDADGRRHWRNTMTAAGPGPARMFRGELKEPPHGTHWRFGQAELDRMEKDGRIYYSPSGMPYVKSYLDERKGRPVQNIWTDIAMSKSGKDRLGYPTQKPIPLLRRIIEASSDEGDVVFDPFCGCGTTIYAANELKRRWIGCDIAILSVQLIADVIKKNYGLVEGKDFEISGIPMSVDGAKELFNKSPFQFQHWAVERVGGFPTHKKVADHGIDGNIYFQLGRELKNMVLSVKGGNVRPTDIRDLRGVLERDSGMTVMAGFISLQEPSKAMKREAAQAGMFEHEGVTYDRIQLLTIQQILEGKLEFRGPVKVLTRARKGQLSLPV